MFFKLNPTARILTLFLLAAVGEHQLIAAGPAPVNLGSTASFTILAGAAITTTGGGIINGNVGASPIAGSAIGVTCSQVNGIIYEVDPSGPPCAVVDSALLTMAKGDLTTAYNDAAGRTPVPSGPNLNPGSGNIGGMNLAPGLYKFTTTALITGSDVTLTGGPDDVWIFQCAQDLQLGSGIKVILAGGARAKNIYWQVGTSAVLGTSSVFSGTILANQSITMGTSSTIDGRALASSAGVTFNGNGAVQPNLSIIAVQQPAGRNLVNDMTTNSFGTLLIETSDSLTFVITNTGNVNITGVAITIDGPDAALFTVTTNAAATVGPGSNTTFTVQFAPLTTGTKNATLHIANNDVNNNPFNIALIGGGALILVPGIAVQQPPGVNLTNGVGTNSFGPVLIDTPASLTFIITNTGSANLAGLAITIDGPDAALFTVTTNAAATVGPGSNTTFTVQFAPLTTGTKNATLHIANNVVTNNPFNLALTGTGVLTLDPGIAVQQPPGVNLANGVGTNNFGAVLIGTNTSLTFIITNTGDANLTGLAITINGPDAALFTVTTNAASTVAPGSNTTFTVQFAPLTTGTKNAALHLANNVVTNNPFNLALAGTGALSLNPRIAVQQPPGVNLTNGVGTNNFGAVLIGTNTSLTFIITNTGDANLAGLAITIDGPDATLFTVTTNAAATVAPGSNTTFTVQFTPISIGVKTAALHLANNVVTNNPFNLALTGTGVNGRTSLSTDLVVIATSPLALNPQSGLFTNSILVTNISPNTIAAVRLYVLNLLTNVQVYYADGATTNGPYVQSNFPLAPDATVDFTIEYYSASRQPFAAPAYAPQDATAVILTIPKNSVGVMITNYVASSGLIGFRATPKRTYAVQYSTNMISWQTATPYILAPVNYIQWFDLGPPKTEPLTTTRFYRVLELP